MPEKHTPMPWAVANESIDPEGRKGFRLESLSSKFMVGEFVYTGFDAAGYPEDVIAFIIRACNAYQGLTTALTAIAALGGNLPDDRLTSRTGPNDAADRGLKYCEARRLANEALQHAQGCGSVGGAPVPALGFYDHQI